MKVKALTPIIATILLIVISVILVVTVLSWGKNFTTQGLRDSDKVIKECNQITMFSGSKVDPKGNISFKNISPGNQTHTIVGYKILSTSEDSNFNNFIYFEDENKTVTPGSTTIFQIPKFPPEEKFTIQLLTDKGEYISLDGIKNVPEELQDISEEEHLELEPLFVAIYSPTDQNNWDFGASPSYMDNSYKDFNVTITGGTGEYSCSWNLKRYDSCGSLIEDHGIISTNCSFNMQLTNECTYYYYELTVSSPGFEDVIDGIYFLVSSSKHCQLCPL